jgi:hypothetical protein
VTLNRTFDPSERDTIVTLSPVASRTEEPDVTAGVKERPPPVWEPPQAARARLKIPNAPAATCMLRENSSLAFPAFVRTCDSYVGMYIWFGFKSYSETSASLKRNDDQSRS